MSDSYQAIYDAVRSRISGCDVERAIRDACNLDAGHAILMVQQSFQVAADEMSRPSVLYRPSIAIDGNKWSAVYGDNVQEGVAGFGDSPAEAMADFDRNWAAKLGAKP